MNQQFIMAGVMGWPVAHSRSPLIHNYWIKQHQLSGAYGRFPVEPKKLEAAIRGLSALGIAGCNITIPHKVAAMQYMDWVAPLAQQVGAINPPVLARLAIDHHRFRGDPVAIQAQRLVAAIAPHFERCDHPGLLQPQVEGEGDLRDQPGGRLVILAADHGRGGGGCGDGVHGAKL